MYMMHKCKITSSMYLTGSDSKEDLIRDRNSWGRCLIRLSLLEFPSNDTNLDQVLGTENFTITAFTIKYYVFKINDDDSSFALSQREAAISMNSALTFECRLQEETCEGSALL